MLLSRYPRIRLAHLPTPLEFLPRLTEHLGGPNIYVKRDDCTGLATGGNKTRKLEFLMAEAQAQGATAVVTQGAVQSNHARQTAAAAAKLGLACELVFEKRVPDADHAYLHSGNVLLDRMLGARIREVEAGADMEAALADVAEEVREAGGMAYVIPGGGSNPVGALGYVDCAAELVGQANREGLVVDHVVHASGSAGTQAGLVVGMKACHADVPVLGICVNAGKAAQEARVLELARRTAEHLGVPGLVGNADVSCNGDYVGAGYGIPTEGMNAALLLLARLEGLLFDPVYSGKALAGLIDLVRQGYFAKSRNVVFIHTGGTAGLFAYEGELAL